MILEAPAKVNLSLRVLRRREDGYHEITTRMAPLTLADRVSLTCLPDAARGTVEFSCDDPTVPLDGANLAVRAVRALEVHTGPLPGVAIHLEKRIPHGAGLGGGSSDAAAVLKGLNALFALQLPVAVLSEAAAAIGSDVPFFLYGCVCDCGGRGEAVAPVAGYSWRPRLLLIKPPFGVPTPTAYRRWLVRSVEVVEVAVSPKHQGKGIGTQMVEALLEGREEHTAVLSARCDSRAHELYRRLGFEEIARVTFSTAGAPFYIMGRQLPPANENGGGG